MGGSQLDLLFSYKNYPRRGCGLKVEIVDLKVGNYVLFGALAEDLNLGCSGSDLSEGPF